MNKERMLEQAHAAMKKQNQLEKVKQLMQMGNQALPEIGRLLKEGSPAMRECASLALAQITWKLATESNANDAAYAIPEVLNILRGPACVPELAYPLWMLIRLNIATEAVADVMIAQYETWAQAETALQDKEGKIPSYALYLLTRSGVCSAEAVGVARKACMHPLDNIKRCGLVCLGHMAKKNRDVVETLVGLYKNYDFASKKHTLKILSFVPYHESMWTIVHSCKAIAENPNHDYYELALQFLRKLALGDSDTANGSFLLRETRRIKHLLFGRIRLSPAVLSDEEVVDFIRLHTGGEETYTAKPKVSLIYEQLLDTRVVAPPAPEELA